MAEEKSKKEIAKEVTQQMIENDELKNTEEMIKKNLIEFELNKVQYRVRKPTLKERRETRNLKNQKYLELVNNDKYLFRDQLIQQLEKKGKSISKMIEQMMNLQLEIENLQMKLAQFGEHKEKDTKVITDLKLKIYEKMQERNLISIEKAELLSCSIEDELTDFVASYFCYLVLEKKEGENWIRVFKSYEDFENSVDDNLLGKAGTGLSSLIFSMGEENEN